MEYQELPSLLKLEAGLASGAGTPERGALPPHLQPLSGACPLGGMSLDTSWQGSLRTEQEQLPLLLVGELYGNPTCHRIHGPPFPGRMRP